MKLVEYIGDLLSGRIERTFDAIYKVLFTNQGQSRIDKLESRINIMTDNEKRVLEAAETIKGFVPALQQFVQSVKTKDEANQKLIDDLRQSVIDAPIPNPPVVDQPAESLDEEFAAFDEAVGELKSAFEGFGTTSSEYPYQVTGTDPAAPVEPDTTVPIGGPADTTPKTPDFLAGQSGATNPYPGMETETPNTVDQPGTSPTVPLEEQPSASETEENAQGQNNPGVLAADVEPGSTVTEEDTFKEDEETEPVPAPIPAEGDMPTGTLTQPEEPAPVPAESTPFGNTPSFNQAEIDNSQSQSAETKEEDKNNF